MDQLRILNNSGNLQDIQLKTDILEKIKKGDFFLGVSTTPNLGGYIKLKKNTNGVQELDWVINLKIYK
jgi:hypothetical protein